MCRFLLSNHADIEVSQYDPGYNWDVTVRANILEAEYNLFEADSNDLERIHECYTLLLKAGADPTDNTEQDENDENGENGSAPFFHVFTSGSVVGAMMTM